uniref:Uncharacterized protein n=1 Tax=Nelumbo nucifera TaxID=4432 RepID=A0A822YZ15_NELNU|nr:TPA_asm: hypothetical protein HUJ06_007106 [Nelumbo nucifera]
MQFLDLSGNGFSGSIPSCLNNIPFWKNKFQNYISWVPIDFTIKGNSYSFQGIPLTLMTGIDLSSNKLTGSIPNNLGYLSQLRSLNLSNNFLLGQIPKSFQNLSSLESLDLSHNNLTGEIPVELTRMESISIFRVAFNNLSGKIPFDPARVSSSYTGNPFLCGEPLKRKCPEQEPERDDHDHDNNDIGSKEDKEGKGRRINTDSPLFFYSCMALSYVLGFWGVVGPLLFNKNYRRKYYRTVDVCIEFCLDKLVPFQCLKCWHH